MVSFTGCFHLVASNPQQGSATLTHRYQPSARSVPPAILPAFPVSQTWSIEPNEYNAGYIEWTIATAGTAVLMSTTSLTKLQLVISTGTIYGIFSALHDAATASKGSDNEEMDNDSAAFYELSASTLMGISVIMFTNSFVSWVVDSIASPAVMSSSSAFNAGLAAVSMCAGVVASKVVVSLLLLPQQQKEKKV